MRGVYVQIRNHKDTRKIVFLEYTEHVQGLRRQNMWCALLKSNQSDVAEEGEKRDSIGYSMSYEKQRTISSMKRDNMRFVWQIKMETFTCACQCVSWKYKTPRTCVWHRWSDNPKIRTYAQEFEMFRYLWGITKIRWGKQKSHQVRHVADVLR